MSALGGKCGAERKKKKCTNSLTNTCRHRSPPHLCVRFAPHVQDSGPHSQRKTPSDSTESSPQLALFPRRSRHDVPRAHQQWWRNQTSCKRGIGVPRSSGLAAPRGTHQNPHFPQEKEAKKGLSSHPPNPEPRCPVTNRTITQDSHYFPQRQQQCRPALCGNISRNAPSPMGR